MHDRQVYILLTIDVEDWFQVENFRQYIPFSSWSSYELRVEKNIYRILDILDLKKIQSPALYYENTPSNQNLASTSQIRATFFVLGWIAERLPHIVQEIHLRGHEVASHGYCHNLCNQISPDDLRRDLSKSKGLLENIIGFPVHGYRAPNFSINDEILKVIEECGYLYDSSYNSFSMHRRYGHLDLSQKCRRGIAYQIADPRTLNPKSKIKNQKSKIFYELPISNLNLLKSVLPWGGGGYFRLIPFPLFKIGIKRILGQEKAYLFYFHPWEIDPEQPKVNQASSFYKFRHYINLSKTHIKLSKLIENFKHCNFITCSQYLNEVRNCAL